MDPAAGLCLNAKEELKFLFIYFFFFNHYVHLISKEVMCNAKGPSLMMVVVRLKH